MTINYHLTKSNLTAIAGKYTAKVNSSGTVELDNLVEMVSVRKTSLGKGDIASVIETLCEVIETELIGGRIVHLGGIVKMGTSIKGTFDGPNSPIDPAVNFPDVTATAGTRVRKAIRDNAEMERIEIPINAPALVEFVNVTSGATDQNISISGLGQLTGANLDFDETDPAQGLFIMDAAATGPDEKVSAIQKATSKEIVFQAPASLGLYPECYLQLRRKQTPTGPVITGKSVNLTVL